MTKRQLKLEAVLGLTTTNNFGIDHFNHQNSILYPAGATLVNYDYEKHKQIEFISTTKSISCIALNSDQSIVAIGQVGHQPLVLVYEVKSSKLLHSFKGHKYGISSTLFSPNDQYLISVGHVHDGAIYIWDWKQARKVGGVKVSAQIHGISFDPLNRFFVTVGPKHVKFWDLRFKNQNSTVVIDGTSAVLGDHKSLTWVDVKCHVSESMGRRECFTYIVSDTGILIMLNESFVQLKWLSTKMDQCTCITVSEEYLFCGGSDGKIRIFEPVSLNYIRSVPLPDPIGSLYPQVVAIRYTKSKSLVVVYSNRNVVVYESNFRVLRNLKHHCDTIWGIIPITTKQDELSHSFVTYSQDGLVRVWNSGCLLSSITGDQIPVLQETLVADVLAESNFKKISGPGSNNDIKDVKLGIRSMAIDPTGTLIACGDRNGTLKFFSWNSFELIHTIDAHDAEIMKLNFALVGGQVILASASRDRLIHIFGIDIEKHEFELLQTIDDHTSTLTCMMFLDGGHKLISCGADKAVIFRSLHNDNGFAYTTYRNTPMRSTLYDMACASDTRTVVTVSQDRKVSFLNMDSGKVEKTMSPTMIQAEDAKGNPFLNSITTSPNGSILCASSSDKVVHLIDSSTGHSMYQGFGHGDLITDVAFINQANHVASASADGCIFIWKLAEVIKRKVEPSSMVLCSRPNSVSPEHTPIAQSPASVFRFDEATLPAWARAEPGEQVKVIVPPTQGRWAERVDNSGIVLFSEVPSEQPRVAKLDSHRRYSFETSSSPTKPLEPIEMKPSESLDQLDISVHVVEGELSFADSIESLPSNPFADTIETDSEDAIEEMIKEEPITPNPDRNSLSFQYLTTPKQVTSITSSPSLRLSTSMYSSPAPTDIELETILAMKQETKAQTEVVRQQLSAMGIHISPPKTGLNPISTNPEVPLAKEPQIITEHELNQFELLAQKTVNSLLSVNQERARETLERVNKMTSEALGKDDWSYELLKRYSENLVQLYKQKLNE